MRLVAADLARLLLLADGIDRVAPVIADLDLGLFHAPVNLLDQVLATLLGQGRDIQSHHGAVSVGRDADIALLDRLLDSPKDSAVPGLDDDSGRFRHADAGQLVQWRQGAVVVDLDTLDE